MKDELRRRAGAWHRDDYTVADAAPLNVWFLVWHLRQGSVLIANTVEGTHQEKEDEKCSKSHSLEITTVNILMYNLLYICMCVYILYIRTYTNKYIFLQK